MHACLLEMKPPMSEKAVCYFYLDAARVARSSCGIAFLYREERFHIVRA